MGAAWVAGTVRARLLARRRLGRARARELARAPSLVSALRILTDSPYRHDVEATMSLPAAQRAVEATALWHLRVLAGWLPPGGAEMVRTFAGRWEIENVDDRLVSFLGIAVPPPFALGSLATSWPRIAEAVSVTEVRGILAASPWGDPGGDDAAEIALGLQLGWARRLARAVPAAADLAAGWSAVLVARSVFVGDRPAAELRPRPAELGADWVGARSVRELADRVPRDARWVLEGVAEPQDVWRAEARWWSRLETEGLALLSTPGPAPRVVAGSAAVLTADAWRTAGALEMAARGGRGIEVFDAVG
ncbi:MAG TPA: hypothetical protein VIE12_06835 [Actinomycetota bacterium]